MERKFVCPNAKHYIYIYINDFSVEKYHRFSWAISCCFISICNKTKLASRLLWLRRWNSCPFKGLAVHPMPVGTRSFHTTSKRGIFVQSHFKCHSVSCDAGWGPKYRTQETRKRVFNKINMNKPRALHGRKSISIWETKRKREQDKHRNDSQDLTKKEEEEEEESTWVYVLGKWWLGRINRCVVGIAVKDKKGK